MLPMTVTVLTMEPAKPTMDRAVQLFMLVRDRALHSQPAATPIRTRQPTATHRAFTAPGRPVCS